MRLPRSVTVRIVGNRRVSVRRESEMNDELPVGVRIPPCIYGTIHRALNQCTPQQQTMQQRREAAIDWAWAGLNGYCESADEASAINSTFGSSAATYGEVTLRGARAILGALLREREGASKPTCVFLDLGSGVAKMVALAALEYDGVTRSIGVELAESRHVRAVLACERLRASVVDVADRARCDKIELQKNDMLQAHAAIDAATHVYLASLLFDDETMRKLTVLLDAAPNVAVVATLRKLPLDAAGASHSFGADEASEQLNAQMDWNSESSAGNEVFLYRRLSGRLW